MRPRRRARRHNELYCGHVDWLLEPWNHQAIRGGRRRRAGGSADRSVDRGDHCRPAGWNQVGATAQDAAGPIEQALFWHRVDGSEPATTTFAWAGGNADASGGIVTYKGVDPFVGFDQGGSAASSAASGGTTATGNALGLAVTTSAANEMLQAAYGVANGVTVTQTGAQGLVREWTVSSTGGAKVTAGFADGVQAAAGASGNKTATWVTSSLWVANLFALKNEAADGSGTVVASFTAASASQSGLTETLTYTPAAGSMANGERFVRRARGLDAAAGDDAGRCGLRLRDRRQRRKLDRGHGHRPLDGHRLGRDARPGRGSDAPV